MDAGRGSYICGLVLGLAVGVAGAHVALGGRPSRVVPLPVLSIGAANDSEVGRAELPSLDGLGPELKTAFAPSPTTVHAIATSPVESEISTDGPEPPRQLPAMPDAEPLQSAKPSEDADLRAFIREELKSLAASEHQIWYETLQGLSREDATEILKIWKLSRGFDESIRIPGIPQLTSMTTSDVESPAKKPVVLEPEVAATKARPQQDAVQQACLHNLANAATPGFKCWDVMMFDHASGADAAASQRLVWINHTQGKGTPTARPYDLCIQGPGFFKVRRGAECYLTRCGRFVRAESGQLALPQPDGATCPLEPEIVIPEKCTSLKIDAEGNVSVTVAGETGSKTLGRIALFEVFDPSALKAERDNLFAMTPASGSDRSIEAGAATIWQGAIEESNVDVAVERRKLEAISVQVAPR